MPTPHFRCRARMSRTISAGMYTVGENLGAERSMPDKPPVSSRPRLIMLVCDEDRHCLSGIGCHSFLLFANGRTHVVITS